VSTAAQSSQPLGNMRFRVAIAGTQGAGAVEVIFPEARLAARGTAASKRPVRYGTLILRKGLTQSREWYEWWYAARRPAPAGRKRSGRDITVTLMDAQGRDACRWLFSDAHPQAYQLSSLNALGNEPVLETLELSVGDFRML